MFVTKQHHGAVVWVMEDYDNEHWEHCLCAFCEKFNPHPHPAPESCLIAAQVYSLCVQHNLVLPVWECPNFKEDK